MSGAPPVPRIACVQHGDYWDALQRLAAGGEETYGHQAHTVSIFEALTAAAPRLVVSLDAPAYYRQCADKAYAGVPPRAMRWLPRRWSAAQRASEVLGLLERFRPTHLLLRACDVIGCRVLEWAAKGNIPTAVMIAARFDAEHAPNREFCRFANARNVSFVGNHNRVATASLLACGLQAEKAIAWDYVPKVTPEACAAKCAPGSGELNLLYAGAVSEAKGVVDLIDAVTLLRHRTSLPLTLTICGDGPLRPRLLHHPGRAAGWLELPGSLPSRQVMERMRESWLVAVPTRPAYPEALPLVITEALVTRTPLLISDHPIFRAYFRDDEGIRFFRAGDASSLAVAITGMAAQPDRYARLSQRTAAVWRALQIETRFDHLIERFVRDAGLAVPGDAMTRHAVVAAHRAERRA